MTSTQIILLNSVRHIVLFEAFSLTPNPFLLQIVVSSVVIMNTKRDYLLDEDFEPKAVALINFVCNDVYYAIWPPAEQQLQQPFSSTLLTNRKKNRVKVKLPTNFVANFSH
ncbi:hypothetical protein TYRP_018758 [Tyrophagus putrescentiae]|nr:hypothetical protein TYRP_018758 [Tyrophagus putrescentiae]